MTPRPALERALRRLPVSDSTDCWLWPGALSIGGYGVLRATHLPADGNVYVHRLMYESLVRPIPVGMQLDHTCHSRALALGDCLAGPCRHRRCVNPLHLEVVTPRENVLRGGSSAARAALRDTCANLHEYTPENTYLYHGKRQCQTCRRAHRAAWRARRKIGDPNPVSRKPLHTAGGGRNA